MLTFEQLCAYGAVVATTTKRGLYGKEHEQGEYRRRPLQAVGVWRQREARHARPQADGVQHALEGLLLMAKKPNPFAAKGKPAMGGKKANPFAKKGKKDAC
jgi:hypothetical protein